MAVDSESIVFIEAKRVLTVGKPGLDMKGQVLAECAGLLKSLLSLTLDSKQATTKCHLSVHNKDRGGKCCATSKNGLGAVNVRHARGKYLKESCDFCGGTKAID
jgi:hypothetical protein